MRVLFVIIIYGLAKQITFQRVGCNHFSSARFYGGLWSKDYSIKGFVKFFDFILQTTSPESFFPHQVVIWSQKRSHFGILANA